MVFTTNIFLRLYDEMFFSLVYDELARKHALRRTNNDETCFFANSSKSLFYDKLITNFAIVNVVFSCSVVPLDHFSVVLETFLSPEALFLLHEALLELIEAETEE